MAPIESHPKDVLGSIAESQVEITGKEPMIGVKGNVEYEPDRLKTDSEAVAQYGPEGKAIDLVFEIEKGEIRALTVPNPAMTRKKWPCETRLCSKLNVRVRHSICRIPNKATSVQ